MLKVESGSFFSSGRKSGEMTIVGEARELVSSFYESRSSVPTLGRDNRENAILELLNGKPSLRRIRQWKFLPFGTHRSITFGPLPSMLFYAFQYSRALLQRLG